MRKQIGNNWCQLFKMVEKEGTRKKYEPFKRMTESRADIFDWVPWSYSKGEESCKTEEKEKEKGYYENGYIK